jgi:hypothetical protein
MAKTIKATKATKAQLNVINTGESNMGSNLTTEHLAWILDITRKLPSWRDSSSWGQIVKERMGTRFPESEHTMIWECLLNAIGAK